MEEAQKILRLFGLTPKQQLTEPITEPVVESKPFIRIQDAALNLNNATLLLAMKK